ncbi:MAG: sterol desaturase family protein [Paracoccaceae bacterium]|nr:sterol desaturase family protein [Paracoccaceae bacterium]
MDETKYGRRNKRGDWVPHKLLEPAPIWLFPPQPRKILSWIPGFLFPYNVLFMVSAVVYWYAIVPDLNALMIISWNWTLKMLATNMILAFLWYQGWEMPLYISRRQGNRFKYNNNFPNDRRSKIFWFRNQTADNMARSMLVGVPIWTAMQILMFWSYANGYIPLLKFADNPLWLLVMVLVVPIIHDFHFYCIHRFIHLPILYKWIHSVHHKSANPSPWSSLSMHPLEHVLYFATIFWHFILPSNPIIALYQLHFAGFGAVPGHIGFDKIETSKDSAFDTHAYMHYLHHKYFEVNYGGDGLVPFDRVFGTYHDGSKESDEQMKKRLKSNRLTS